MSGKKAAKKANADTAQEQQDVTAAREKWSLKKKFAIFASPFIVAGALGGYFSHNEHETSHLQSDFFGAMADQSYHQLTRDLTAPDIAPPTGPYDVRLGYTQFDEISQSLENKGYILVSKASGAAATWQGPDFLPPVPLFPLYDEKNQAGLDITDSNQTALHNAGYPNKIYTDFAEIPELVVKSLLYVENREQLDEDIADSRNYAIEWDRKFYAVLQQVYEKIGLNGDGSGGSTLAEQLEKLRHSEGGHTNGMLDKATQVFTASARAYSESRDSTLQTRQKAVANYINAVPLSGYRGFGEVIGMADGLGVWFGTDVDDFNRVMSLDEDWLGEHEWEVKAQYYRQTLALIMAVQQPTTFLRKDRKALDERIDRYLPSFARAGIISEELKDHALSMGLKWAPKIDPDLLPEDPEKSINLVRVNLMQAMGLPSMHDFDRMDISATSTIDYRATQIVNTALKDLGNPYSEKGAAVIGDHMARLDTAGDIQYSFTLYEREGDMNHLRVQTDNFEGEFNLNEDSMLELGSTAKFRTLITYLEYTLDAYKTLVNIVPEDRPELTERQTEEDGITAFVLEYLNAAQEPTSEKAMLDAAMERIYSAHNGERFFTGGGLHRFHNFMVNDNWRDVSVKQAFEDSINLPFIRMMEDVVQYTIHNKLDVDLSIYDEYEHPLRKKYLDRYVLHDAIQHFSKMYQEYEGKNRSEVMTHIFAGLREDTPPAHIAAIHRYIKPDASLAEFSVFLSAHTGESHQDLLTEGAFESLHRRYAADAYDLNDRAYITDVHPIEIWLAAQMMKNPDASYKDLRAGVVRMAPDIYKWLEKSNNENLKSRHVFTMLEQDAFDVIHDNWAEKGFPFRRLIPSFATSIGVSGDTPNALATLMGIVVNGGKAMPNAEFTNITLGKDTPYEKNFVFAPENEIQVMDANIAAIVKENLENIVQNGTARRTKNAIVFSNGVKWAIGGKTGTGDNRIETHDRYGNVTLSTVRNRTATFVFTFGDKYYGSMVAYAAGEEAADEEFTSSLPVKAFSQIIKDLTPIFEEKHKDEIFAPVVIAAPEEENIEAQPELVIVPETEALETEYSEDMRPIFETPEIEIPVKAPPETPKVPKMIVPSV
jgi:membrane peptidoglycan carboxypeptidase